MAIVDDKEKNEITYTKVNIMDASLDEGEARVVNQDADAWQRLAPPPDSTYSGGKWKKIPYKVKLFLAEEGIEKYESNGKVHYRGNLELRIQDDKEFEGISFYAKVNTDIGRGKEISTVLGLIRKCGASLKVEKGEAITPRREAQALYKLLLREPTIYVEITWKAGWDDGKQRFAKTGMPNFPRKKNGTFHHIVNVNGEEMAARAYVTRWLGKEIGKQEDDDDFVEGEGGKKGGDDFETVEEAPKAAKKEAAPKMEEVAPATGKAKGKGKNEPEDDFSFD